MIVQPDFPDHWKTQSLVAATSDPAAPLMVIRLWAHCQYRRRWKFKNLSDIALAGICKWHKDPGDLRAILLTCGFIDEQNAVLIVHDWEHVNATIIARWKGGETNRRRLLAQDKLSYSLASSSDTSEKSRVEKKREDKNGLEKKEEGAAKRPASNGMADSEWLERLKHDQTYEGIDVGREFGKCANWCREHRVTATRRRFINWINRVDKPLTNATNNRTSTESGRGIGTANEGKSAQYKGVGQIR